MADTHVGGCFCGAVEIEVKGLPEEMVTATAAPAGPIRVHR